MRRDVLCAVYRQWWYCATHIQEANWASVGICVASLCVLALCKILNRKCVATSPLTVSLSPRAFGLTLCCPHEGMIVLRVPRCCTLCYRVHGSVPWVSVSVRVLQVLQVHSFAGPSPGRNYFHGLVCWTGPGGVGGDQGYWGHP